MSSSVGERVGGVSLTRRFHLSIIEIILIKQLKLLTRSNKGKIQKTVSVTREVIVTNVTAETVEARSLGRVVPSLKETS